MKQVKQWTRRLSLMVFGLSAAFVFADIDAIPELAFEGGGYGLMCKTLSLVFSLGI